jgi:hypothetical protein
MTSVGKGALITFLTIAVSLFVNWVAFAQAPFCDVIAASNFAPPPTLPVRDIRFEQEQPLRSLAQPRRAAAARVASTQGRPKLCPDFHLACIVPRVDPASSRRS